VDFRQYRRVRLRLTARLRWSAPLGQASELTETIDVSRGGLLLRAEAEHAPGTRVWVAFPYEGSLDENQPEIAARVVRTSNGSGRPRTIALELLEGKPRRNANGAHGRVERRSDGRSRVAVPVWVRPEYVPWPEEAMTVDVSANGLRFVTSREYAVGERLLIKFGAVAPADWPADREEIVRVTRTMGMGTSALLESAVRRERAAR
jgi:hypothetical protein